MGSTLVDMTSCPILSGHAQGLTCLEMVVPIPLDDHEKKKKKDHDEPEPEPEPDDDRQMMMMMMTGSAEGSLRLWRILSISPLILDSQSSMTIPSHTGPITSFSSLLQHHPDHASSSSSSSPHDDEPTITIVSTGMNGNVLFWTRDEQQIWLTPIPDSDASSLSLSCTTTLTANDRNNVVHDDPDPAAMDATTTIFLMDTMTGAEDEKEKKKGNV